MNFIDSYIGGIRFAMAFIEVTATVVMADALVAIAISLNNKRKEN